MQGKRGAQAIDEMLDLDEFGSMGDLFTVRVERVNTLLVRATSKVWAVGEFRTGTIAALSLIVSHPGISQNEISKQIIIDKSAINGIVNSLEAMGWVRRQKSSVDRRRHAITATAAGEAALKDIVAQIRKVERRMLALVPHDILVQLRDLLDQVHASCIAATVK